MRSGDGSWQAGGVNRGDGGGYRRSAAAATPPAATREKSCAYKETDGEKNPWRALCAAVACKKMSEGRSIIYCVIRDIEAAGLHCKACH